MTNSRPPVSGEPSLLATSLDAVRESGIDYDWETIEELAEAGYIVVRAFEARATPPALPVDDRPCTSECCDAQERRHIHEGAHR